MKMDLSVRIFLTKEEVLEALTEYVRETQKYSHPDGFYMYNSALDVAPNYYGTTDWLVTWGEKKKEDEPENEVPAAPRDRTEPVTTKP